MKEEKQKNWTQIDAFDEFHLMTITEYNEHGGCVSNSSSSYGFDNSPSYNKSDVDLRIEIYDDYKENFELFHQEFSEIEMPDDITKHYLNMDFLFYWMRWLFVFCFGDMTEDFKVKIEKLEEKKI